MAVTNLQERTGVSKSLIARSVMGDGSPVGDATLNDPTNYPVGTDYLDLETGDVYHKVNYNSTTLKSAWAVLSAGAIAS